MTRKSAVISPNSITFFLSVFVPVATLVQGLPVLSFINKALIAILAISLLFGIFSKPLTLSQIFSLILILASFVLMVVFDISASITIPMSEVKEGYNIYFYFPLWCLYFLHLQNNHSEYITFLKDHTPLLRNVCLLWCLLVVISFAFPSSYGYLQEARYFESFASGTHRFASSCLHILSLSWVLVRHKSDRRYYLFSIIPIAGVLVSGARTYLILAFLVVLGMFFSEIRNVKLFLLSLIPILAIGITIVIISPIGSRLLHTLSGEGYGGYWFVVTSGRSDFWMVCLRRFLEQSIHFMILGGGATYVHRIFAENGLILIWAHNDFIQVLLANGVLGIFLFLSIFFKSIANSKKLYPHKTSLILWLIFLTIWIFNAFFNGVFFYMCAMFSLPLFFHMINIDIKSSSQSEGSLLFKHHSGYIRM